MEGPVIKDSYSLPNDEHLHPSLIIKKERPDGGEESDKVLQFKLALQRYPVSGVITVGANNDDERPQIVQQDPRTIELIDLSLSDDEDDLPPPPPQFQTAPPPSAQIPTEVVPPPRKRHGDDLNWKVTITPQTVPQERPVTREEPSSTVDIRHTNTSAVPSPQVDEEELDYAAAMSSLELQLDETDQRFSDLASMEGRNEQEYLQPRRSLPYTEEEKRIALEGNKDFDYRTRLDEHGEEKYAIFKCPKCPTGFPRMHHYLVHLRSHGRKTGNFKCPDCDLVAANSAFLANHLERHQLQREPEIFDMTLGRIPSRVTEKLPLPSPTRLTSAKRHNNVLLTPPPESPVHARRARSTSPVGTSGLDMDMEEPSSADSGTEADRIEARKGNPNIVYRRGRRSHPNGRTYERTSYKCLDCPYSNEKYEIYLNHVEGHREERPYPCDQCTFSAKTQKYLDRHVLLHTYQLDQPLDMDTGVMDDPDDPFWTLGAGRKRKRRGSGPGRPPKVFGSRTSTSVQCPKCPSKLSGPLNLKIHLKQHGKTGLKFHCSYCDYASNRDDYMRNHMDAHVKSVNNASLSSSSSFRDTSPASSNHDTSGALPETLTPEEYEKLISGNPKFTYMTVTTSGQPLPVETSFKCWHCPYATAKYSFLVTHQQRHEVNSKYGCNQCTYSASSIQALKNHKLAHTIQHAQGNKTTNGQSISFRGETLRPRPSPSPSLSSTSTMSSPASSVHESRGESGQFFISNIRITNIMAMNQEPTVADVSTHGILKLKGNSEEGKSSYILAVMLGLGYDLVLDHRDETTSICGLNLKNAISDGQDFGSVELTVSLRAFPQLQKDFGSQIKFSRRIERRNPQLSNVIAITSADPRPQFKQAHPKVFNGRELTNFLPKLKLSPERLRLMLLDGENVKYFMDNTHLWYVLFEAAVEESDIDAVQKTNETQFLLERLDGKEKLQRERLEWFQSRLGLRPPVDSEKIRQVSEEDWTNHRKCTTELNQLANERKELEQKLTNYAQQSRDSVGGYIQKMRSIFHKFLDLLNYHGEIMVCERSRSLAICIWKADAKEVRPTTLEGVDGMWRTLSNGKRRIAVIGLYLALWEISCYLGIVAADAFSCTEADFHVPPAALPVLWDLVNRKCLEQKQCIVSLPPEY